MNDGSLLNRRTHLTATGAIVSIEHGERPGDVGAAGTAADG